MTAKHTPSPWLVRVEGTMTGRGPEVYVEGAYYDDDSEFVVADLGASEVRESGRGRWVKNDDAETIEANARLIAAAPELADALREHVAATSANLDEWEAADATKRGKLIDRLRLARNAAFAALAKAGL